MSTTSDKETNKPRSKMSDEARERMRVKAKAQWAAARDAKDGGLRAAVINGSRIDPPTNAVEIVQKASANGCTVEQVAQALGVGRTTFADWRDKYPAIDAAMKGGRAVEHDRLVGKLFELAMKGSVVSSIFLLKARHGYVEGVPLVQNTVSINFQLPGAMTPDAYVKTIEATAQTVEPEAARKLSADPKVKRALKNDFKAQRRKLDGAAQ